MSLALAAMSGVVVSRFDGTGTEWDEFVRAQAGWTHFHLYGWRAVIERVFGHDCIYLVAREAHSNRLSAVLPLVRVKSRIFGHYLISMPFLNYGGPVGSDDGVRAVVAEASRIAASDNVKLMELRSARELPLDLTVSHRKVTVLLDLPQTPDALWSALPSKLRSQIRRPKKEGVEIRFGPSELDAFYRVFAHHMRDLGTPAQPKSLFEAIQRTFPNDVHIAVAYHNNLAIACGWGFLWDGEFEITWASALRSHSSMSPNMLVYWELMARVIGAGARVFNFGRCTPDSGTYRFKMQWGGRQAPLWWYQQSQTASDGATPSPDKGAFALAARMWQRLPVPLATKLGPAIVRYIP